MRTWCSCFIALLLFTSTKIVQAEETILSVNIKRLTFESSVLVVQSAIDACRKQGVQIAVAVVDRGGNVQLMARDTLATDITAKIARDKAYTALSFNVPTSELSDRARSPLAYIDGLAMLGGGLPINVGGIIYGAVGVSGAPTAELDEKCAMAGLSAITEELEMTQ